MVEIKPSTVFGFTAAGDEKRVKVDWCSSGFTPRLVKDKGARY